MRSISLLVAALILVTNCNEDTDRYESLIKLRGLGANANPLVSKPNKSGQTDQKVEITVYAALPLEHTVSVESFKDQEVFGPVLLNLDQIEIKSDSISYDIKSGFQLVSFKASLTMPEEKFFEKSGGAGQVRYGFLIKDGDDVEKIIGNVVVYPEGSTELAWQHPGIEIASFKEGAKIAASSDVEIAANLVNVNNEELAVGWFVGGGEIKNRRSKLTTWTTPGASNQTIIATVRGKKSRGFAMQILSVIAE